MPWQTKEHTARALAQETEPFAARARAAGFQTTEYVLKVASAEIWKDIEKESANLGSR